MGLFKDLITEDKFYICHKCLKKLLYKYFSKSKIDINTKLYVCDKCINKDNINIIKRSNKIYHIYVITNKAWSGWVKIGRAKSVNDRFYSYNTYSPHRDYILEFHIKVKNIRTIELYFFNKFPKNKYEWYNISVNKAIKIINNIAVIAE